MAFLDLEFNESPEQQQKYHDLLRQHSICIRKSVDFLLRALQLMIAVQTKGAGHYHGVVFVLARHVAEELDAASVLVAEGCTIPCKSHLRSAFEAELGVQYILKADSERRAIGYLVKHARDRIRWYDKTDPGSQAGTELRSWIGNEDIAMHVLSSLPPFDFEEVKKRLTGMLQRAPYMVVNDEWQRFKRETRRHPAWHALFGGPKTVRDLAFHLDRGFWYEFLYSDWSGHVHAGSGLTNIGTDTDDPTGELTALRPLRHPDGLKIVLHFAQGMALELGNALGQRYLSKIGQDDLRDFYMREVRPLNEQLKHVSVDVQWK
jgi:hypothetical protein